MELLPFPCSKQVIACLQMLCALLLRRMAQSLQSRGYLPLIRVVLLFPLLPRTLLSALSHCLGPQPLGSHRICSLLCLPYECLQFARHPLGPKLLHHVAACCCALCPRLLPVRHHAAHQPLELTETGLSPVRARKPVEEGGAVVLGLYQPLYGNGVGHVRVQEGGEAGPVGGYDGQAHGHGLHLGAAPALTAGRDHERVGGLV
mmetsp:Transcript_754/g.1699  ORF Transcript_754/g.1699 Transcript_754/m.1699 type:complete len:203 (-) Transcript_754:1623-2231(-)